MLSNNKNYKGDDICLETEQICYTKMSYFVDPKLPVRLVGHFSANFVQNCEFCFWIFIGSDHLKLSKELKEKLLGSDWEGLGLGIRISDLNLSILAPVKFRLPIST